MSVFEESVDSQEELAKGIIEVAEQGWREYDFLEDDAIEDFLEKYYSKEDVQKRIKTEDWDVLVSRDDKVTGFLQLGYSEETAEIFGLYIREGYRNQGIGTELLEEAEAEAIDEGCDRIQAPVFAENTGGKEFFGDQGYHKSEVNKFKFMPGAGHDQKVTEHVMEKKLE